MNRELDPELLKLFSFQVFTKLEGAVTAGMIHLGDRLGLYAAMRDAGRPLTTSELAEATGTIERWVREWAYNQAAAKLIEAHEGERFGLCQYVTPKGESLARARSLAGSIRLGAEKPGIWSGSGATQPGP